MKPLLTIIATIFLVITSCTTIVNDLQKYKDFETTSHRIDVGKNQTKEERFNILIRNFKLSNTIADVDIDKELKIITGRIVDTSDSSYHIYIRIKMYYDKNGRLHLNFTPTDIVKYIGKHGAGTVSHFPTETLYLSNQMFLDTLFKEITKDIEM